MYCTQSLVIAVNDNWITQDSSENSGFALLVISRKIHLNVFSVARAKVIYRQSGFADTHKGMIWCVCMGGGE